MRRVLTILSVYALMFASPLFALDAPASGAKPKTGLDAQFGKTDFKKEPTFITSTSLTVKSDQRIFNYIGNVKVTQGDMTLTCDELEGRYNEKNQIEQLVAKRNVLITKGLTIKATGQKGVYTASNATLVLTENPTLEQNGSTLSADVIKVFMQEDRSVAEGDVRMKLVNTDATAPAQAVAPIETATPIPEVSILGN